MWRRNRDCARRFLIDPVKEMVNKGIETATTGAGWLKGGPQMVSDVVCGIIDTWVSVIDPNEGTIRKAMSGDAATLDELASLASTIGSIVFVVYVCMTAVNLFLATAESVPAWKSTSELGYGRGDGLKTPRHRADAATETTSRRWRGAPEI